MSAKASPSDVALEALSALVDGQASDAELDRILAQWDHDEGMRDAWVSQNRVGEFMRSPELETSAPSSQFLQGFKARLAKEPVVLAPAAAQRVAAVRPMLHRRKWLGPTAVAASFVAVVSALVGALVPPMSGAVQGISVAERGIVLTPQEIDPTFSVVATLPTARALVSSHAASTAMSPALGLTNEAGPSFSRPLRSQHSFMPDARLDHLQQIQHGFAPASESFSVRPITMPASALESP